MVYFCIPVIRHIMDGCIIFLMLDLYVAKYFSKTLKTHVVRWYLLGGILCEFHFDYAIILAYI